jgi:homotetrameric cytidine deaminase
VSGRAPEALAHAARRARQSAYAPFSGYGVGCALEASDGRVFTGCNVENASFGLTLCAERSAVAAAVVAGARAFRRLVIDVAGAVPAPPCGACRQVLAEFAPDLEVWSRAGGREAHWTLDALLPSRFAFEPDGVRAGRRGSPGDSV